MTSIDRILSNLLSEVASHRRGFDRDIGVAVGGLESWQDDHFIYVEAAISVTPEASIDICIHDARAFIRIARPSTDPLLASASIAL